MDKPVIHVVAAVIVRQQKIFCAQRKNIGPLANKWEFPGGKIEKDETPIQALNREISEELGISISLIDSLSTIHHEYPTFQLHMMMFLVTTEDEILILPEHAQGGYFTVEEMQTLDWAEADNTFVKNLGKTLNKYAFYFQNA